MFRTRFHQPAAALALVCLAIFLGGRPATAAVTALSAADPANPGDTASVIGGDQITPPELTHKVSGDGRFVVFPSYASNLAPGEEPAPRRIQLYLRDRWTGTTTLITRVAGTPGTPTDGNSFRSAISRDGRWVVFVSQARNLVAGQVDTNNGDDVFLYDRVADTVTLVSHAAGSSVTTGNNSSVSETPAINADGSWIAFSSSATNLVTGITDTNSSSDVFLYETATGTLTLVSRTAASATTAANRVSKTPSISGAGDLVTYLSQATNLVTGQTDTNNVDDVFVWDRATGTTVLASHTVASATTAPASSSVEPSLTFDGAFVLFRNSSSSGLVTGQTDTNGNTDLFLWERATGAITLISHTMTSTTTTGNSYSYLAVADDTGSRVAYYTYATNLVPGKGIILWDRATNANQSVGYSAFGGPDHPSLSGDGRFVAFQHTSLSVPGITDSNLASDVYLFDSTLATTEMISRATSGTVTANAASTWPLLSADGSAVVFVSAATDLVAGPSDLNRDSDLFGWERSSGLCDLISPRDPALPSATATGTSRVWPSPSAALSANGQRAVFLSLAPNVVPGQVDLPVEDLFLYDAATGTRTLVSRALGTTTSSNGLPRWPALSADGNTVIFASNSTTASNLLTGITDTNQTDDLYAYDVTTGVVTLVSRSAASATTTANSASVSPAVSADGRWVAFLSYATNLVTGQSDTNGGYDVFLHDRQTGATVLVSHTAASVTTAANVSSQYFALSADGNWVTFTTTANNVVTGTDTNNKPDTFLYSRLTGTITLVSHSTASATAAASVASSAPTTGFQPALNADGSRVAFVSYANNLTSGFVDYNGNSSSDVYLFDRATGTNSLVSRSAGFPALPGNATSGTVTLSADGAWVAFLSLATDLVTGQSDTNAGADVFLYSRATNTNTLVSRTAASATSTGNNVCTSPVLSADGTRVAFLSRATNHVTGQTDSIASTQDVFLYDRLTGTTLLASHDALTSTTAGNADSLDPAIDEHGTAVAFTTTSANLVAGDSNGSDDAMIFFDQP